MKEVKKPIKSVETTTRDITGTDGKTYFEKKCTFEWLGKTFEAGGAFIGFNKITQKHSGIVYEYQSEGKVGNWHGDIKVNAIFGRKRIGSFGEIRQSVWFIWRGIKFYGICSNCRSDIKAREIKKSKAL